MMVIDKAHSTVWETTNDCWDDFLNDPEISREIESVRASAQGEQAQAKPPALKTDATIGERLLAYETPITEEILRQSIK